MAEQKTIPNEGSVEAFLNRVPDPKKCQDSFTILEKMKQATGEEPKMWGDGIVGFGSYRHKCASGRKGDWFLTGFSPRAQNLALYFMAGFDQYDELMSKLGKYKTSKACLYIKIIEDIELGVLQELVRPSAEFVACSNS